MLFFIAAIALPPRVCGRHQNNRQTILRALSRGTPFLSKSVAPACSHLFCNRTTPRLQDFR